MTLHETKAIDDYAKPASAGERAPKDRERRWQDVPDEGPCALTTVLRFSTRRDSVTDLPAYLVWYLRNFDTPAAGSNAFGSVIYSLGGRMRGDFVASYKDRIDAFTKGAESHVIARFSAIRGRSHRR